MNLQINEAEDKAWKALAQGQLICFGYWASLWVYLNKMSQLNRRNPFGPLVELAQQMQEGMAKPTL